MCLDCLGSVVFARCGYIAPAVGTRWRNLHSDGAHASRTSSSPSLDDDRVNDDEGLMLLPRGKKRRGNQTCLDDEIRDDETQGMRLATDGRRWAEANANSQKERKNLGVWAMTPDTPHCRSGARQIGLFFFFGSSPMSIPQIHSAVQTRNSKLSPSPYCASQTFFQTRGDGRTDGTHPDHPQLAAGLPDRYM